MIIKQIFVFVFWDIKMFYMIKLLYTINKYFLHHSFQNRFIHL